MFRKKSTRSLLSYGALVVLTAVVGLSSLWNHVRAEKASTENLGGPERYLTCVSTDKPIYKPGEKVYVRGVMIDAMKHTPKATQNYAAIEIRGPKGDIINSGGAMTQDGAWGFAWDVPKEQGGGEFTLRVSYPGEGFAPAERKFDVRAYRAPRLRSQIVFLRDGYGPGDKVTATLHTERAEGGIPEGCTVRMNARVDGVAIDGAPGKVDASGNASVTFELPKTIERGEGALALIIEDGGVLETASKTIPILLQSVDVKIYPEGGDLIAGAPNRVYFEARTPAQKPADIAGTILDSKGIEVGKFRSEHEGRGQFELQVQTGNAYVLRIDEPAGIKKTIALPDAKTNGAVLHAPDAVTPAGKPVRVAWACDGYENIKLVLAQRERELDSKTLNYLKERSLKDGSPFAWTELDAKDAEGVLIVTIYDAKTDTPLAERLIFRQPAKQLKVSISADKNAYVPGDTVNLTIKTTDADGKAVAGMAGVTVTDDSVLEMIEKREQAPRLPAMALLEGDVQELADAQIYLDAANPKAPAALDLLLGTQGWRRFALMDIEKFLATNGDAARRAMALRFVQRPVPASSAELGDHFELMAPMAAARGVNEEKEANKNAELPQAVEALEKRKAPANPQ